jgi:hypothetical protein
VRNFPRFAGYWGELLATVIAFETCMHLFIISLQSLKLYETLSDLSFPPARALLKCLMEGRGLSLEADHLRYACAMRES